MKTTSKIAVKQQTEIGSKNWGIYLNGVLIEGGFFDKYFATEGAWKLEAELKARKEAELKARK